MSNSLTESDLDMSRIFLCSKKILELAWGLNVQSHCNFRSTAFMQRAGEFKNSSSTAVQQQFREDLYGTWAEFERVFQRERVALNSALIPGPHRSNTDPHKQLMKIDLGEHTFLSPKIWFRKQRALELIMALAVRQRLGKSGTGKCCLACTKILGIGTPYSEDRQSSWEMPKTEKRKLNAKVRLHYEEHPKRSVKKPPNNGKWTAQTAKYPKTSSTSVLATLSCLSHFSFCLPVCRLNVWTFVLREGLQRLNLSSQFMGIKRKTLSKRNSHCAQSY